MAQILSDLFGRCFGFFEEEIRLSTFPKKNKKNLENEMEDLKRIQRDVTTIFQEQEGTRPGTECKVVVSSWLDAVNVIDTQVNTLLDKLAESRSCTCCCFPRHNYLLGKHVVDLIKRVNLLVEEGKKFDNDNLVRPILPDTIHNLPDLPTTMIGRDRESSEIHDYLRDSEVTTIGILGRGGIGKTTLMLKSIKQWLSGNDHDFGYIIWIEMSQNDDYILKIQKRIASSISPSLKLENDEQQNAIMLANALRSKKSLVLIDNVWKELDFVKIGIPFAEDTVVKIFFTTRSERVLAQKIVRLGSLNEAESLELFQGNISPVVDLTDTIVPQRVDEILRRCGGLPLVIVTVARTVANYTRDEEWVHAVESLRMYGSQITGEEIEGGCFKLMDKFPKKNKENLEKEMDKLKGIRDVVSTKIREQERKGGTECQVVVKRWLDDVNGIETEVKTLVDDLNKTISCTCRFPCHNYFLEKDVVPLIDRVHALVEDRTKFDDDNLVRSILPDTIDNVPDLPITMIGRDRESSEIHGYLRDSEVTTIGILGRGGIGKTTLMLKSIKQWLSGNDHDFGYIIWIEMFKNDDDIHKIQKRIASCILLTLQSEHDEWENARMLDKALRSKKSLVLIDNVWKELDFVKIGIPFAVEKPIVKILFTTRSERVCHDMTAQKIVRLDSLNEADSLELFKRKSCVVDLTGIREHVDEILRRCGGLPLVIVTVARAVANYTKDEEWEDAVRCLRRAREEIEGMDEVMEGLKFSYDMLEDDKIKSCLLYLSLYPEGAQIYTDFLIKQWLAEGFLDTPNDNSFKISYNRGFANINKLKSICLVENSVYSDDRMKLHHEIRHMLCQIRKHEKKEGIYDRWDLAKGIYLREGQVRGLPSCPNLTSLLVGAESYSGNRRIFPTEEFFHFTPSLRVLDLSYTGLVDIPKSIGKLVELRYLNLSYTRIRALPKELGNLKKLKCLDLGNTKKLVTIVGSAISQLSALQSLNLCNTSYQWKSHDVNMRKHLLLKLEDLRKLKKLEDLGVDVKSNSHLDTILCDKNNMLLESISRISFVRIDFTTADNIDLGGLQLTQWISLILPELKNLIVNKCALATDILEIKNGQLPRVTELNLRRLKISCVTLNDASRPFSRLKVLKIFGCRRLKEVSWAARIPSLEELIVDNCNRVKELVEEEEIREERLCFPKLTELQIRDLENLKRVNGRSSLLFPALRRLIIRNCPKLKQLSFDDDSAKNIEYIKCKKIQWDLLEWENDEVLAKFSLYVRHRKLSKTETALIR